MGEWRAGTDTPDPAWVEARFPGRSGRVTFIAGPLLGVSSSEIRARVETGRSIRYLVPDAVAAYIGDRPQANISVEDLIGLGGGSPRDTGS